MSDDNLTLGIQAAKAGKREQARSHLAKAIQLDPGSEEGWLWLGHSMDEQEKRKYCYQRVLALNPANSEAWRSLDELTNPPAESAAASVPPQPAEPEPVPESGPDKDEKASQNKKRERFWPTVLFGFLLTLILVALPAGAIILTGHLDNLLISKNITILPPMPPIYEHWVDSVVTPTPIPIPAGPFDDRLPKRGRYWCRQIISCSPTIVPRRCPYLTRRCCLYPMTISRTTNGQCVTPN